MRRRALAVVLAAALAAVPAVFVLGPRPVAAMSGVSFRFSSQAPRGNNTWYVTFTADQPFPAGSSIRLEGPPCTTFSWSLWTVTIGNANPVQVMVRGMESDQCGQSHVPNVAYAILPSDTAIPKDATVTIAASGVTNPYEGEYPASDFSVGIGSYNPGLQSWTPSDSATAPGRVLFDTSVADVTFEVPARIPDVSATWTVRFTTATALSTAQGDTVTVSAPATFPTGASSYTVTDEDAQTTATVTGSVYAPPGSTRFSVPFDVPAGHRVTLTIARVTNPSEGDYPASDFAVATSQDGVPASPSQGLSFAPGQSAVSGVDFQFASDVAGDAATWTVSFIVTQGLAGGDRIRLAGPPGTAFSSSPGDYVVYTDPNGPQTTAQLVYSGGGTADVSIVVGSGFSATSGSRVYLEARRTTNPGVGRYAREAFLVATTKDAVPAYPLDGAAFGAPVTGVSLATNSHIASAYAIWTVTLHTGPAGALAGGSDTIALAGPSGTAFSGNPADYAIDGQAPTRAAPSQDGSQVVLTVPADIGAESDVTIVARNVRNPSAGEYQATGFSAWTSVEFVRAHPGLGLSIVADDGDPETVDDLRWSVSSTTPGAPSDWTLEFTVATWAETGVANIVLTGPAGTVFPQSKAAYSVNGRSDLVQYVFPLSGGDEGELPGIVLQMDTAPPFSATPAGVTLVVSGVGNPPAGTYGPELFGVRTTAHPTTVHPASGFTFGVPGGPAPGAGGAGAAGSVSAGAGGDEPTTVASPDGLLSITVPAGAAAPGSTVVVTVLGPGEAPPADADLILVGGRVYEVRVLGPDGQPLTRFDPPLVLSYPFDPAVLPPGAGPDDLAIFYWDRLRAIWVPLPSQVEDGRVTAEAPHLTPLALMAAPDLYRPTDLAGEGADVAAEVLRLARLGIVSGYPDGTFRPAELVSRAEAVRMLALALGLPAPAAGGLPFSDAVPAWAQDQVAAALAAGLVTGYPDGSFRAGGWVTREELAVLLERAREIAQAAGWTGGSAAGAPGGAGGAETVPSDIGEVAPWAVPAVTAALGDGLLALDAEGRFQPRAPVTRAELALALGRLLDRAGAPGLRP
ncbi:MAG: S-layer homology domain-containing protein [Clostridia bacterium]|nr:S-layer homology domain-containing protein [Clostridia bacterium]